MEKSKKRIRLRLLLFTWLDVHVGSPEKNSSATTRKKL